MNQKIIKLCLKHPLPTPEAWRSMGRKDYIGRSLSESLVGILDFSTISEKEAADLIGVSEATFKKYLKIEEEMPYPAWFTFLLLVRLEDKDSEDAIFEQMQRYSEFSNALRFFFLGRDQKNLEMPCPFCNKGLIYAYVEEWDGYHIISKCSEDGCYGMSDKRDLPC